MFQKKDQNVRRISEKHQHFTTDTLFINRVSYMSRLQTQNIAFTYSVSIFNNVQNYISQRMWGLNNNFELIKTNI